MPLKRIATCGVLAFSLSCISQAQDKLIGFDRGMKVYAGYAQFSDSFEEHASAKYQDTLHGFMASFDGPILVGLRYKVELSRVYDHGYPDLSNPPQPEQDTMALGGPEYAIRISRATVFAQALFGSAHYGGVGVGQPRPQFEPAKSFGGGGDIRIFSHLSFRVQDEVLFTQFNPADDQLHLLPNEFQLFSTGVVWTFRDHR